MRRPRARPHVRPAPRRGDSPPSAPGSSRDRIEREDGAFRAARCRRLPSAGASAIPSASSCSTARSRWTSSPRTIREDPRCLRRSSSSRRRSACSQAAIEEGPVHAYLFHGPPGVGKQKTALAFAAHLLGDRGRVERRAHPDLYLLEPLGDQIRIDEVRSCAATCTCARSRPSGASTSSSRRTLLNDEAADALLKDLEEPPPYAVIILLADELGPAAGDDPLALPARPLQPPVGEGGAHGARRAGARAAADRITALARVAGGRLDRAERLLDEDAAARREELLGPRARRLRRPVVRARRRRPRPSCAWRDDGRERGSRGGRADEVGVARPARPRERAAAAARGVRRQCGRACSRRWRS